ncbi:MAG: sortase [Clostridia bacterium]
MKSRTIVIKNKYLLFILILAIVFFIFSLVSKYSCKKSEDTLIASENTTIYNTTQTVTINNYKKKEAYKNMPQQIEGYEVIGRLEIPKIDLNTYILSETNKDTLKVSVTKLCGPKVNGVGNLCIAGHNYNNSNMFGNLKNLEKDDKVYITDIYDNKFVYVVYEIYKVFPKEVECLSQNTNGEREITLITCTKGAIKRLIIKAVEIYD